MRIKVGLLKYEDPNLRLVRIYLYSAIQLCVLEKIEVEAV
jgi:hypothetical protein